MFGQRNPSNWKPGLEIEIQNIGNYSQTNSNVHCCGRNKLEANQNKQTLPNQYSMHLKRDTGLTVEVLPNNYPFVRDRLIYICLEYGEIRKKLSSLREGIDKDARHSSHGEPRFI